MFLRVLTLIAGVFSGALSSQFPEFSQQYTQRLGGAVDALGQVVAEFDASAASQGMTRDQALRTMQGSVFLGRRQADMKRVFARHERLATELTMLMNSGPFMRAYYAAQHTDGEVARRAWAAYRPAVPLTAAGAIFAVFGFVLGAVVLRILTMLILGPFRRGSAP